MKTLNPFSAVLFLVAASLYTYYLKLCPVETLIFTAIAINCAVLSFGILLAWRRTKRDLWLSRKQCRAGGR